MITTITTRQQFLDLRSKLGVRMDWHEPDEQGLTAKVVGKTFDNAGFDDEKHVELKQDGNTYRVNLACLLSWASGGDA